VERGKCRRRARALGIIFIFNTSNVYSNIGDVCSNIGDVYSNIGDVYSNIGDIYSNIGDARFNVGNGTMEGNASTCRCLRDSPSEIGLYYIVLP